MNPVLRGATRIVQSIVFMGVVWIVVTLWTRSQLEHALIQARAVGLPLSYADLQPAPIEDSRNAAFLYMRAWEMIEESTPRPLGALVGMSGEARWDRDIARSIVEGHREALSVLRRAGMVTECRFPIDYAGGRSAVAPVEVFSRQLRAGLLLAVALRLSLEEGRPDESAEYVADLVRCTRGMEGARSLLATMIEDRLAGLTMRASVDALRAGGWRNLRLREAIEGIEPGEVRRRKEWAVDQEQFMREWVIYRPDEYARGAFKRPPSSLVELEMQLGSLTLRPLVLFDTATTYRYRHEFRGCSGLPFPGMKLRLGRIEAEMEATSPFVWRPRHRGDSQSLMAEGYKASAQLELLQMALEAIERRDSKGAWDPATPCLGTRRDPFSGFAYVSRIEGDTLVMYSVGPNGRDDGGEAQENPPSDAPSPPDDIAIRLR